MSDEPVYMLTPLWSETPMVDPRNEVLCRVMAEPGGLVCLLRVPTKKQMMLLSIPVREGGSIGDPTATYGMIAWGMRRLGPGVWALNPSIRQTGLHAFVILCDVPEPPPWAPPITKGAAE